MGDMRPLLLSAVSRDKETCHFLTIPKQKRSISLTYLVCWPLCIYLKEANAVSLFTNIGYI